jgi:hypothetical protein
MVEDVLLEAVLDDAEAVGVTRGATAAGIEDSKARKLGIHSMGKRSGMWATPAGM